MKLPIAYTVPDTDDRARYRLPLSARLLLLFISKTGALLGVAALTCAPYVLFLGYRPDYLAHYIAGVGGTLLLLTLAGQLGFAVSGWRCVGIALLGIAAGLVLECTVFKIAKFDPVDFANQSLGACVAGLYLPSEEPHQVFSPQVVVLCGIFVLVGLVVAFPFFS